MPSLGLAMIVKNGAQTLANCIALALEFASPATTLRAVSIRAQMKDWSAAANLLSRGLELFPQNPELLQSRLELEQTISLAALWPATVTARAVPSARLP
jgi:hypothetical protein